METEFEQKLIFRHLNFSVCFCYFLQAKCLYLLDFFNSLLAPDGFNSALEFPLAAERLLYLLEAKMKVKQAHARSVLHQERMLKAGKPQGSSPLASVPLSPVKPQIHTYHGHTETAFSLPADLLTSFL